MLDARALRTGKKPTRQAIDDGLAKIVVTPFGSEAFWHVAKTAEALRSEPTNSVGADPGATSPFDLSSN
jgi:hypothetical protein